MKQMIAMMMVCLLPLPAILGSGCAKEGPGGSHAPAESSQPVELNISDPAGGSTVEPLDVNAQPAEVPVAQDDDIDQPTPVEEDATTAKQEAEEDATTANGEDEPRRSVFSSLGKAVQESVRSTVLGE